ncbi:MAG: aminotransferase class V-fold PLP-dependent enzyme [Eubacteriales bacterium]|nr:aminotransferase class V-fold PLP-dependent enzyme [Eubacteriales bacterium]
MQTIYLDHAATSFPKPPGVAAQMQRYVEQIGASVNRGSYDAAQQVGLTTLRLRQRLGRLLGLADPAHVILTPGNTWGLNLLLWGTLHPGDHVLVSAMEHNAVMRPLTQLARRGVTFDRIPCDAQGRLQLDAVEALLRPETRLVVLAHASNVSGTVQDVAAVGAVCAAHGIPLALDAAQSAGHLPIDLAALGASALSVPAHKGLLGPQGVGALLLRPDFAPAVEPLVSGGTGSASDSEDIPPYLPDRLEPGTPNLPGIYGWEAALAYLEQVGVDTIAAHERELSTRFLDGLRTIDGVRLYGPDTADGRVAVFSLDFVGQDNAAVAARLEEAHGILTRCGLHCAPSAHRTLGTFPRGTVRLSFGWSNTAEQVDRALAAVTAVSAG